MFVLTVCIFWLSSILASIGYVFYREYTVKTKVTIEYKWLVSHIFAAAIVSSAVTIWFAVPHSLQATLIVDHCHNNQCVTHLPAIAETSLMDTLYVFFILAIFGFCTVLLKFSKQKLDAQANSLLSLSSSEKISSYHASSVNVIHCERALLLNVGMLKPRLIVSSKVVHAMDARAMDFLVAYELNKGSQFEILKVKLISILCVLWPRHIRHLLICDLRNIIYLNAQAQTLALNSGPHADIDKFALLEMPKNERELMAQVKNSEHDKNTSSTPFEKDKSRVTVSIIAGVTYFMCLIALVYNGIHVLLEVLALGLS